MVISVQWIQPRGLICLICAMQSVRNSHSDTMLFWFFTFNWNEKTCYYLLWIEFWMLDLFLEDWCVQSKRSPHYYTIISMMHCKSGDFMVKVILLHWAAPLTALSHVLIKEMWAMWLYQKAWIVNVPTSIFPKTVKCLSDGIILIVYPCLFYNPVSFYANSWKHDVFSSAALFWCSQ